MEKLTIGVIGTSRKEDEKRLPIHPDHLSRIPLKIRQKLVFEEGYGAPFNLNDDFFRAKSGGVDSRHNLLTKHAGVIIAKPVLADLQEISNGGLIWGYPHCVQQQDITQEAIDKKLTLIAFEDMFTWSKDGRQGRHTFYKNNEMAGYCAVLHALHLRGIDGHYGDQRKVIIFSLGAVSRGAIYALKAHGFRDITICIQRPDQEVREEILDVHYIRIREGVDNEPRMVTVEHDGTVGSLFDLISESDIIINGIYQDTDHPIDFIKEEESSFIKSGSLIIDISCDEGMGFYFARPTTFKKPMLHINKFDYYAVDHTPSYLWESATRSISAALIVYLSAILAGHDSWMKNETIRRAINVDGGAIMKEAILSFQHREENYPHEIIA